MKALLWIKDSKKFWEVFSTEREKVRRKLALLPFAKKIRIMEKMRQECLAWFESNPENKKKHKTRIRY